MIYNIFKIIYYFYDLINIAYGVIFNFFMNRFVLKKIKIINFINKYFIFIN